MLAAYCPDACSGVAGAQHIGGTRTVTIPRRWRRGASRPGCRSTARPALPVDCRAASLPLPPCCPACLPAVQQRMKSVANIQKITKAMKMVAASKMRAAQANTENSRGIVQPLVRLLGDLPAVEGSKNVFVPITSDKGLCGGINTTVCK